MQVVWGSPTRSRRIKKRVGRLAERRNWGARLRDDCGKPWRIYREFGFNTTDSREKAKGIEEENEIEWFREMPEGSREDEVDREETGIQDIY